MLKRVLQTLSQHLLKYLHKVLVSCFHTSGLQLSAWSRRFIAFSYADSVSAKLSWARVSDAIFQAPHIAQRLYEVAAILQLKRRSAASLINLVLGRQWPGVATCIFSGTRHCCKLERIRGNFLKVCEIYLARSKRYFVNQTGWRGVEQLQLWPLLCH